MSLSYSKAVIIEKGTALGVALDIEKSESFKEAMADNDIDYTVDAALDMGDEDKEIITLNLKGYDNLLPEVVKEIQSVSNISMLLKSEDIASLESALRIYNGKPAVYLYSSIAEEILPLAKKYGALIVTDQIGKEKALSFGINKKEIVLEEIFS